MSEAEDITELLHRFQASEEDAKSQFIDAVHGELRMIAARYMRREKGGHTLQTTALVNEAYMKLVNFKTANWQDRVHFYAVASRVMRRILVDHARKHIAGKRGGGIEVLPLNEGIVFMPGRSSQIVQLDEALTPAPGCALSLAWARKGTRLLRRGHPLYNRNSNAFPSATLNGRPILLTYSFRVSMPSL
jgi:RNA polymerase sigma factor (TIGR02999 family)